MAKKFVVSARLEAEDRASRVIGRVQGRFAKLGEFVKNRLVITMGDAARAIGAAFREIERVASLQSQTDALKRNLLIQGVAFDGFISKLKEVSDAQVAESTLIEASGKALLLGIPADKIAELMDVARVSAIATGDSIKKSFEDIVVGVGRASPMILDNLGIVVKLQDAYDAMASELGTTSTELTAQQKKMALLNAVLETGKKRVENFGDAQSELAKRLNQSTAAMQEFKDKGGSVFGSVALSLGAMVTRAASAIPFIGALFAGLAAEIFKLGESLPFVGDKFAELGTLALQMSVRMQRSGNAAFELANKMTEAGDASQAANLGITKAADAAEHLGAAATDAAAATGKLSGATKELSVTQKRSIRIEKELDALRSGAKETLEALGLTLKGDLVASLEANKQKLSELMELERQGLLTREQAAEGARQLAVEEDALQAVLDGTASSVDAYNARLDETTEAQDGLRRSSDGVAGGLRSLRGEIDGASNALRAQQRDIVTTISQFDALAAASGRAAATQAAIAGGGRTVLGGRRVLIRGGSRLTFPPGFTSPPSAIRFGGTLADRTTNPAGGGRG